MGFGSTRSLSIAVDAELELPYITSLFSKHQGVGCSRSLRTGAYVNERGSAGHTLLRVAARNGRIELVQYFLAEGSEVDSKGDGGATPLEHAASKGHIEIVKLLVEPGANVNVQDKEGGSSPSEAAKGGFMEGVGYLLSKGADITLKKTPVMKPGSSQGLPGNRRSKHN